MRDQVERLLEISPAIPEFIQAKYKKLFKDVSGVAHPQIIGGLHKVLINRDDVMITNVDEDLRNVTVRSTAAPLVKILSPK